MSRTTKNRLTRIQPAMKWVALVSLAVSAVSAALSGNWFATALAVLAAIWAWVAFASQKTTQDLLDLLDDVLDHLDDEAFERQVERQRSGGAL